MTTPASTGARKAIDWEGMKPHYEAGIIPLKTLGKTFGCSDAAIIKHAANATPPWSRNLKGKIQAAADAKVSASVVSAQVSANRKVREAAVVDGNATLQANIRLAHREDIAAARALTMDLMRSLKAARTARGKKKLDLPQLALVNKNLSEAMRVQIGLERQAFGIDDRDPPDPNGADFTERLLNARARAAAAGR